MTINATGSRMTTEIARQARLARDIAASQTAISTGQRYTRASDAPAATARIAQIDRAQANATTWTGNLTIGQSLSSQADGALATLSAHMTQARTLVVAGASSTASAADRATFANELRSIAADVVALRTTKTTNGQPLFVEGTAAQLRVGDGAMITPVASAGTIFEMGGTALSTQLTDAAAALDSGDPVRIGAALNQLTQGADHVADAAADQGLRAKRIDNLIDQSAVRSTDVAVERSALADTDLTTAIAQLNAQQLTLDAAQAAFARINRRTLFDILG